MYSKKKRERTLSFLTRALSIQPQEVKSMILELFKLVMRSIKSMTSKKSANASSITSIEPLLMTLLAKQLKGPLMKKEETP